MIGISFARVCRAAFQNFWRNIWLSVATTIIMVITLLLLTFLYFANIFGAEVLRSVEQKIDLSVNFKENVQADYIQAIAKELKSRSDVEDVRIVDSEEALKIFRERHSDDPLIEESLQELEDNPLPASMYIVATDPMYYEGIAKQLQADKYSPFVQEINYENSRGVFERLINVVSSVKNVGLIMTSVFSILVVLIMFNTVRLAIYSFREEIEIMRLVGASRWFVQGPFIIEALLVAVLAVIVSTSIIFPSLNSFAPQFQRYFFDAQGSQFDVANYAREHWITVVGMQLIVACCLAAFSSLVAVRRYLRGN